ncbi:MAG TPA: ABATE domain-containing protein [Pseudonocardia sp.]|nr:ABATE domain-containing protein [Pseudonocardia sp.]
MSAAEPAGRPEQVGGSAGLDFANTVGPRLPGPGREARDYLPGYPELVGWAEHAGLLTAGQRHRLTALAAADPVGAAAVLGAARRLREAIYQTFAAVARGEPAPPAALAEIQAAYLSALDSAELGPAPAGLDWRWPERGPLSQVLWPIARAAVELAVSGRLPRIRQCPGDDGQCGWLFLDTSKNATRRWCSMRTCGSRVKSRRQAARLRAARDHH